MRKKFRKIEERFWEKVDVKGPDDCWLWTASINPDCGYGAFNVGNGEILGSHVVSYVMHYGDYPPELCVLHTCRDVRCVNPRHLKLGTQVQSNRERMEKTGYRNKFVSRYCKKARRKRKTPEVRFWEKVEKSGEDECWEWIGGYSSDGYGGFTVDGKSYGAHRYSYMITFGKIPEGLWVLHDCDNPRCVNPNHLKLGTPKDNSEDIVIRGRHRWVAPRAVSIENAKRIKELWNGGKYWQRELAEMFGTSQNVINAIICGRTRWYSECLKEKK